MNFLRREMDVSENHGTPQIIHFNRVFHYFHHPFWGFPPIFGSTPRWPLGIHGALRRHPPVGVNLVGIAFENACGMTSVTRSGGGVFWRMDGILGLNMATLSHCIAGHWNISTMNTCHNIWNILRPCTGKQNLPVLNRTWLIFLLRLWRFHGWLSQGSKCWERFNMFNCPDTHGIKVVILIEKPPSCCHPIGLASLGEMNSGTWFFHLTFPFPT